MRNEFICIVLFVVVLIIDFLLSTYELCAETKIDLAKDNADAYIYHNVRNANSGHMGGVATGDINGDGQEDLILSAYGIDVVRDEYTYLPSDQDSWSDDTRGWKVKGMGGKLQADTFSVEGNYSIKFTRKKSGSIKCMRDFSPTLALTGVDSLHFQLYLEDVGEKLLYIDILAPDMKNRFRCELSSVVNFGKWNQIDLNLSKFSIDKGSPDWNNVSRIILKFKGGNSGDIRIDQLYFDHYELKYVPSDQDSWTEGLSYWSLGGNASGNIATSTVYVKGDYSIGATRTGTGTLSFIYNMNLAHSTFSADPTNDMLRCNVYIENKDERLSYINIWASDWYNYFQYDYNPDLNLKPGWNQIDINLSAFQKKVGSPNWNRVGGVVIGFQNSTSTGDNIYVDNLYFNHYGSTTTSSAGAIYLFYGKNINGDVSADTADVTIFGIDTWDLTGEYITLGDINGDKYEDIIIGSPSDDGMNNEKKDSGTVYVIFGSDMLPSTIDLKTRTADCIIYGVDEGDYFGETVHASDINADGISDLIIGSLFGKGYGNNGAYNGEIFIILGSQSLLGSIDMGSNNADISIYGRYKSGVGTQATIGIGDVYGDGQVDIIIGAHKGDKIESLDNSNEGQVFIIDDISNYYGTIDLGSFTPTTVIYGADREDQLGKIAVGDINNDGIDDIIAGAEMADGLNNSKTDCGEVYVFFGSSSLPSQIDLNSTNTDVRIVGIDAVDNFGMRVYAKDINGDGIDDILIVAGGGAGENNEKPGCGDAYVIYGNYNLSGTLDLSISPPDLVIYGVDADDKLRDIFSGDIVGDDINDIILGFRHGAGVDNTYPYSGEVYIIDGSALK